MVNVTALLAASLDLVNVVDTDLRLVYVNPAFCSYTKKEESELLGKTVRELGLAPERIEEHESTIRQVLATGEPVRSESSHRRPEGARYFDLSYVGLRNPTGEVNQVVLSARDITEHFELVQSLRLSEARSRAFFDMEMVGAVELSMSCCQIMRANRKICELTGYEEEELLTMQLFDLEALGDPQKPSCLQPLQKNTNRFRAECLVRKKTGETCWLDVSIATARDTEGQPLYRIGLLKDIDARKRAEIDQLTEQRRLELALEISGCGAWELNLASGVLSWTDSMYTVLGVEQATTDLMEAWTSRVHPDDLLEVRTTIEKAIESLSYFETHYRIVHPTQGIRFLRGRGMAVGGAGGKMVGVTQDETTAKLLEDELELRVKERTAALTSANLELEGFTRTISHDFRGPLRMIIASAQILVDELGRELKPAHRALLKSQEDRAKQLSNLMDQLLRLARLSQAQLSRSLVDVSGLAADIIKNYEVENLKFSIQPGMLAMADPALLQVVLANLLENAVKFSPNGGLISIGFDHDEHQAFFVQDEGIGFDLALADQIFLPFERLVTESEFPGTGVGLANVQRIVNRHGGRIWAKSKPGQGSCFYFTLGFY